MSSIWIVLLDVSGSMDDGFSGAPTTDPLAERGMWRTKLEARPGNGDRKISPYLLTEQPIRLTIAHRAGPQRARGTRGCRYLMEKKIDVAENLV
jgi:hypothetical protein